MIRVKLETLETKQSSSRYTYHINYSKDLLNNHASSLFAYHYTAYKKHTYVSKKLNYEWPEDETSDSKLDI